jgi:hypothetical protein
VINLKFLVKRFVVDCRKNYAIQIKGNVKVRCYRGWAIFPRRSVHGTIFSTAYILKLKTMSISTVSGGHAFPKAGKKKISHSGKAKSPENIPVPVGHETTRAAMVGYTLPAANQPPHQLPNPNPNPNQSAS